MFEKRYLKEFNIILGISDMDTEYFSREFLGQEVHFIPPLVRFNPLPALIGGSKKRVIICGSFTWEPKIENLIRLLDANNFYKLDNNGIELLIVGNATNSLVTRVNRKYAGVLMTGYVESTEPYYLQSSLALIPELLGGGFKLKLAEAVSFGKPIIALNSAVSDNHMINGVHYLGVDSFEEMIEETIKVANDVDYLQSLAQKALELFEVKYSEEASLERLKQVFN